MASKKVIAAIKGSIANPEAAELVLAAIDADSQVGALEVTVATTASRVEDLDYRVEDLEDTVAEADSQVGALEVTVATTASRVEDLEYTVAAAAAVDPIDDPSTATAEDVATKLNELIVALQG